MKKVVSLLFVLVLFMSYAAAEEIAGETTEPSVQEELSEESVQEVPEWKDFCPAKFIDAQTLSAQEYAAKSRLKIKPTQKMLENYNNAVNHWQDRKEKFDYFINICNNFSQEKQSACYVRVKEREARLNALYYEEQKKNSLIVRTLSTGEQQQMQNSQSINPTMNMIQNMTKMFNPQY